MARSTWAAFECSSLASRMRDTKEQERLFFYGYKTGLTFIDALKAEKIQQADLSSEAPWLMLILIEGPTPDFILGRIYGFAEHSALQNVLKSGDELNPDDIRSTLAQSEYTKRNCRLIGSGK